MSYRITLAVGDRVFERTANAVCSVSVVDGTYMMRDSTSTVVFSAPYDSVVCVELT